MAEKQAAPKVAEGTGRARSAVPPHVAPAASLPAASFMMLGNQALQSLLAAHGIQAKLALSQPGDASEDEADRVADAVMSGTRVPTIRRTCAACAGEEPCETCASGTVQRSAAGADSDVSHRAGGAAEAVRSGGQPLPRDCAATSSDTSAASSGPCASTPAPRPRAPRAVSGPGPTRTASTSPSPAANTGRPRRKAGA